MKNLSRRVFFTRSLGAAAMLSTQPAVSAEAIDHPLSVSEQDDEIPGIIDTNVNLFEWPFRKLKYGDTKSLVSKLRHHRITQAWAGSYEALFHKDINGVNTRLVEACRIHGEGMLLPFGTVNIAWPDWEEDLKQCHEVHRMRGIRIYPIYQSFDLDHPEFIKLITQATARGMTIQIVGDMEDSRHHHPAIQVREMNAAPLVDIMTLVPEAKIQLVYWNHKVTRKLLEKIVTDTNIVFDTARIEGVGEVGRLIEGTPWNGKSIPIPVERFLFGSHAPYFPVEANIIKLFESPLTREQMRAIMNGNARRFLPAV